MGGGGGSPSTWGPTLLVRAGGEADRHPLVTSHATLRATSPSLCAGARVRRHPPAVNWAPLVDVALGIDWGGHVALGIDWGGRVARWLSGVGMGFSPVFVGFLEYLCFLCFLAFFFDFLHFPGLLAFLSFFPMGFGWRALAFACGRLGGALAYGPGSLRCWHRLWGGLVCLWGRGVRVLWGALWGFFRGALGAHPRPIQ